MASLPCRIEVTNTSDYPANFYIFQEPPKLVSDPQGQIKILGPKIDDSPVRMFSTILQTNNGTRGRTLRNGSRVFEFEMDNTYYALYGSKRGYSNGSGMVIESHTKVNLGPGGSVVGVTARDDKLMWDDWDVLRRAHSINDGSFQLRTDDKIQVHSDIKYIGVGVASPLYPDKIVPMAFYEAKPNTISILYPKMIFYVGFGDFEPGQVVDQTALRGFVKVDFENCSDPKAALIMNEDGTWWNNTDSGKGVSVTIR